MGEDDIITKIFVLYLGATGTAGGLAILGLLIWFLIWVWDHTFSAILSMFRVKKSFVEFLMEKYRDPLRRFR